MLVSLLLLFASGAADWATAPIASAGDRACELARELQLQMREAPALAQFQKAIDIYATEDAARANVWRCLLDYAAAAQDSGKADKAQRLLLRAFSFDENTPPDARSYSPALRKRWSDLKASLPGQAGLVNITTQPSGAEIWLDGERVGLSPLSLPKVILGEHWLRVEVGGKRVIATTIEITRPFPQKVELFLPNVEPRPQDGQTLQPTSRPNTEGAQTNVAIAHDSADKQPPGLLDPSQQPPLPATLPVAVVRSVHPALAVLPLGIGQFLERRPAVGTLFLATELGLLATTFATYYAIEGDRDPVTGGYRRVGQSRTFQVVNIVTFSLLIVDVVLGAIDGFVHRDATIE